MILDFSLEKENRKLEVKGQEFAQQIFEKFGTHDVFEIAEKAGVRIVYESWFPVTIGEFERKTKTICVNLTTAENREKIVAHELGHFFARDLNLNKTEEEKFAQEFTEVLID